MFHRALILDLKSESNNSHSNVSQWFQSFFYFFLFSFSWSNLPPPDATANAPRPSEQPDAAGSWRTAAAQGRSVPRRGRGPADVSWKIPFTAHSKQEPFYQTHSKDTLGSSSARTLSCSSRLTTGMKPKYSICLFKTLRSLRLDVQSQFNWWATDFSSRRFHVSCW